MDLEGIDRVESVIQEDQGSMTVHLLPRDERPQGLNAARIRTVLRDTARHHGDVTVRNQDVGGGGGGGGGPRGGGGGAMPGQGPAEVVLSGPDFRQLNLLAREIEAQLRELPEIQEVYSTSRPGRNELRVVPRADALAAFGLSADEILPVLRMIRREGVDMQIGFTLEDGREVPLTVRRPDRMTHAMDDLRTLRMPTRAGVLPLEAVASVHRMPPPPVIRHHDGRREAVVYYRLGNQAPETGPARTALEDRIQAAVQQVHRPVGYTVETATTEEEFAWFRDVLVPILLLLLAILAITFESLTLPILVLLALPLTLLGGVWALVLSGTPAGPFALAGAVALIGLTVNPAILLVDRMQQHMRSGVTTAGAAALAAVRERTRPVLMTAATTIAGLWPLALTTGEQFELWPPFAIVVMGGLATSTILTLLVVPVGFVILRKLDDLFGRLGPWVMIGWVLATAAVIFPLVRAGLVITMTWQILTTVVVAGLLLGLAALVIWRPVLPEPDTTDGPPSVEVRYLGKIYGRVGPIGRAWRVTERFAARVLARGGTAFDRADARAAIVTVTLLLIGVGYLAWAVQTRFWEVIFLYVAAGLASRLLREIRRARGRADEHGRVEPGGVEGVVSFFCPWFVTIYIAFRDYVLPRVEGEDPRISLALLIPLVLIVLFAQQGRRTAVRLSRGDIPRRVTAGRMQRTRILWRWLSRRMFGLDLPREEVRALTGAAFRADRGMVGILGPNGAGKTTLLRILAGILDPSVGTVVLGGVRLQAIRKYLARWVGYLPQDFGLPVDMTAREYLEYYALLYEIPEKDRRERVERLLKEVGLGERAGDRIGSYSGGMRQRVAVARTLLRLPPIIIVDEPTVGLDPRERIRFRNLLSRLAEGRIVLFSTHVVEDVAVACERVIVLARGRLVFDGVPDELAAHAEGKVWEVRLAPGEEKTIAGGARIVDQVPEADGRARTRILSTASPHGEAQPVEATLEDGYLVLAGDGGQLS
jgi:ABC-type multidrug transport system ATPase subunit